MIFRFKALENEGAKSTGEPLASKNLFQLNYGGSNHSRFLNLSDSTDMVMVGPHCFYSLFLLGCIVYQVPIRISQFHV